MSNEEMNTKYLSAKALALVSEFALVLYRLEGIVINVDADDVLSKIAENAKTSTDVYLRDVYIRLRCEMRNNFLSRVSAKSAVALQSLVNDPLREEVRI